MKTAVHFKSSMTRFLSFLLTLTLCIPMLFALTSPASAANSRILFGVGTSACQGNLSSCNFPSHQSTVTAGQQLYVNVAATSDIKLKTIEAYVSENGGGYSLVGRETARNYLRWATFAYTPAASGSFTVFVRIYYTSGKSAEGKATVSVEGGSTSGAVSGGNTMDWDGTCYTVVPNLAIDKCYNQNDYPRFLNRWGKNRGCTATAMCTAYSIFHNTYLSPNNVYWNNGTNWEYAQVYVKCVTQTAALENAYNAVHSGIPVIIGVAGGKAGNSDHVVTVVGVRQGADYNNLYLSDFLIADPYGGGLCSLSAYGWIDTGWSLRIPI